MALCEEARTLNHKEKEFANWKLKQHEEIDKFIQPCKKIVEEVERGSVPITQDELDKAFSAQVLGEWIDYLLETRLSFDNLMGLQYAKLVEQIKQVQVEADFLLDRSNTGFFSRLLLGRRKYEDDMVIPPPDSPPARSSILLPAVNATNTEIPAENASRGQR